jgi:microcystin degradation protein MlrC
MRLALIHIGQETNDFNPVPTTLRDYEAFGIFEGPRMIEELRGIGQVGGHLAAVDESGLAIETVPIIRAWATAGGRITQDAFNFFQRKIADGLRGRWDRRRGGRAAGAVPGNSRA